MIGKSNDIEVKLGEPLVLSPENLRALRKRAGLTQAQLAEELGRTERQIQRWEAGDSKPKDPILIHRLVVVVAPEHLADPDVAHIAFGGTRLNPPGSPCILISWAEDRTPVVLMAVGEELGLTTPKNPL